MAFGWLKDIVKYGTPAGWAYQGADALLGNKGPKPGQTTDPSKLGGIFGPGAPDGGFSGAIDKYFVPELERAQKQRDQGLSPIDSAFQSQFTTPGGSFGAAKTAAEGVGNELFAPGGQIAQLISTARGNSIKNGFAPDSAFGDENNILRAGVKQIGDTFSQQAAGLENSRLSGLASAYGKPNSSDAQVRDLMESIFTGLGSIEQLNLAKQQSKSKFLGIF